MNARLEIGEVLPTASIVEVPGQIIVAAALPESIGRAMAIPANNRTGTIEDVEAILQELPAERQTALFSATIPPPIAALARSYGAEGIAVAKTADFLPAFRRALSSKVLTLGIRSRSLSSFKKRC